MSKTMILVDREALFVELQMVFDVQTADTLLNVLDKVAAQVYAAGVTREDFSELKQIVAKLAEEQSKLVETQRNLVEAQQRSEERLTRLEATVAKLVETQQESEKRLIQVELAIENLTGHITKLTRSQQKIVDKLGRLQGRVLELTYRDKVPAFFGKLLRRPKVVNVNRLWDNLETHLSSNELDNVLLIDLIVKGKPRCQPEVGDIYLAVEVSFVIDRSDVDRAERRAKLLQRAGYQTVPTVAGEDITPDADKNARQNSVVVLQDGKNVLWKEALTFWTKH